MSKFDDLAVGTTFEFTCPFGQERHIVYKAECFLDSMWVVCDKLAEPLNECLDECLTLTDKIKQFTKDTGASVFICDGVYEVYYCGPDEPVKVDSDEQLVKVMDAVRVLQGFADGS